MHHFRKTLNIYEKHNQNDISKKITCSLCHSIPHEKHIEENETMVVVANRVAYDIFEFRRTTGEHFLIVPKRHVESFADFTERERLDHFAIAAKYEPLGFNVYSRGVGNISRSRPHQHTHLIKLANKLPKLHIYLAKPYFVAHID